MGTPHLTPHSTGPDPTEASGGGAAGPVGPLQMFTQSVGHSHRRAIAAKAQVLLGGGGSPLPGPAGSPGTEVCESFPVSPPSLMIDLFL